jgi:hypothetical protein
LTGGGSPANVVTPIERTRAEIITTFTASVLGAIIAFSPGVEEMSGPRVEGYPQKPARSIIDHFPGRVGNQIYLTDQSRIQYHQGQQPGGTFIVSTHECFPVVTAQNLKCINIGNARFLPF